MEEEVCAICRELKCDFESRCSHYFHEDCLKRFQLTANCVVVYQGNKISCPMCRSKITVSSVTETLLNPKQKNQRVLDDLSIETLKFFVKHEFCYEKHEDNMLFPIVNRMLILGWDINEKDHWKSEFHIPFKHTLFYSTFSSKNYSDALKLVELGSKLNEPFESVVYDLTINNDSSTLTKFLELGADPNFLSDAGDSAISYACDNNFDIIALLLVQNGAKLLPEFIPSDLLAIIPSDDLENIDEFNKFGTVSVWPLTAACAKGHINVLKKVLSASRELLNNKQICWELYVQAILSDKIDVIDCLIELNADLDVKDKYGKTPMMVACISGKFDFFETVVTDSKIDSVDNWGNTALMIASKNRHHKIAKYLLEIGADKLIKNKKNQIPVYWAVENNDLEMAKLFLKSPVKYATSEIELLAISCSKLIGDDQVNDQNKITNENIFNLVKLLIDGGVNINAQDEQGCAVLFYIARKCESSAAINVLLNYGADPNLVDLKGKTALIDFVSNFSGAESATSSKIFQLLVNAKSVDLNAQDKDGNTVAHYIASKNLFIMFEILLETGARLKISNASGDLPLDLAFKNDPYCEIVKRYESKHFPSYLCKKTCAHCKKDSCTLETRCKHFLHVSCIKNKFFCPVCNIRITTSINVERFLTPNSMFKIGSLSEIELVILLDATLHDYSRVSFETVLEELEARKFSSSGFGFFERVMAKACVYRKDIDRKLVVSKLSNDNRTLILACLTGDLELISLLLEKDSSMIDKTDNFGYTPLKIACLTGNDQLFELLLKKGVDCKNYDLFLFACKMGNVRIVEIIYQLKGKQTWDGAVSSACMKSDLSYLDAFEDFFPNNSKPQKHEENCLEVVKFLLDNGDKINDQSIIECCKSGYLKAFEHFLHHRIEVSKERININSLNLISFASGSGNAELFNKILYCGSDVNQKIGMAPLGFLDGFQTNWTWRRCQCT